MKRDFKGKNKILYLRLDKIIYATEACATALTSLLVYFFAKDFLNQPIKNIVEIGSVVIGFSYTIYMGVGNAKRLEKIKMLEKK